MAQHTLPPRQRRRGPARGSRTSLRTLGWTLGAVTLVVALGLGLFVVLGNGSGGSAPGAPAVPVAGPGAADLPVSDTHADLPAAPPDPDPTGATDGVVVHPLRSTPVHDTPAGAPFATVGPTQFGDAWFPVVDDRGDWVQILLPSKPSGSAGWIRAEDVERAATPYRVAVHLGSRTLEIREGDRSLGTWPVAVGAAGTPTPTGRTFLLGAFSDPGQDFSPVILPLGVHSPTLDTFGGGPGTVAFHGWPDDSTFGEAVSSGCLRVPDDALDLLTAVPLGTLVTIDQN